MMTSYLLSDSHLLFWKKNEQYFLKSELNKQKIVVKNAVYIGAANGDVPDFFELFQSAMEVVGSPKCYFLKKDTDLNKAKKLLQQADLLLLAGGDVNLGWQFIKPLKTVLERCYCQGTVLVGISAGAMHLAALGWLDKDVLHGSDLFSTVGLLPCIVGVHEEGNNWRQLKQVMELTDGCFSGLGIPMGAGLAVENDGRITAIRKPIVRFEYDKSFCQSLLLADQQAIVGYKDHCKQGC